MAGYSAAKPEGSNVRQRVRPTAREHEGFLDRRLPKAEFVHVSVESEMRSSISATAACATAGMKPLCTTFRLVLLHALL